MDIEKSSALNNKGLELFANGNPEEAAKTIRESYKNYSDELGILVNLGLTYIQQGKINEAEKCYQIALTSSELRTKRAAHKNLGFLHLSQARWTEGWLHHSKRFIGEEFLANQWSGQPLNGKELMIWNDVGMGDLFQFIRYTRELIEKNEKITLAVDKSQIEIVKKKLKWPIINVIDRNQVMPPQPEKVHIPLMSLVALLDPTTQLGSQDNGAVWLTEKNKNADFIGICWASNPNDKTMHKYKSRSADEIINLLKKNREFGEIISLQTDQKEEQLKLKLVPATKNWLKTAEAIEKCKCVYSVDTGVAHLAAGMNCETKLVLSKNHDWRWRSGNWYKKLDKIIIN